MLDEKVRHFTGRVERRASGGVTIHFPFEPDEVWGRRSRYHVTGTIDGVGFRTTLVHDSVWRMVFGRKASCTALLLDGQAVAVSVRPEGPQPEELAEDIALALAARPEAQAAFESLATFYKKGWLRWIEATKRRPEVRAARIAEMMRMVEDGHKERPKP